MFSSNKTLRSIFLNETVEIRNCYLLKEFFFAPSLNTKSLLVKFQFNKILVVFLDIKKNKINSCNR